MKKWQQKALVQKTISFLPFAHRINFIFQKYVTKGVDLSEDYFTDRLRHASEHIGAFERHAQCKILSSSLELGTGWYPVVPVSLFLYGAQAIHTVDICPHCSRRNILTTIQMFKDHYQSGKLRLFINVHRDRWYEFSRLMDEAEYLDKEGLLKRLRINCHIADARDLPLPSGSISLLTSNNTLEHVYPGMLRVILREFRRLAAKGGVMSHFIDMSDHFAHFDQSITIYNYLQYSKRQWERMDNLIQPQNRLRISDYRSLYAELGIPITEELCREGSLKSLSTVNVHREFNGIPIADLAISHCLLVSKM